MTKISKQNALKNETSPYLLQHADNPVEWYPWSDQALELARQQNKPILLSIGYSACHWCHVMAHESFEDQETAELMNMHFINIKVDREERPDLDSIYQNAQHLLTQRTGGWPLTMFLTPDDHLPFFGGTYFPKESRFGLPAFKDLLLQIKELYQTRQDDLRKQNKSIQAALNQMDILPNTTDHTLTTQPLQMAFNQLLESFDKKNGGFGQAPKFPHPSNLERLIQYAYDTDKTEEKIQALEVTFFTLEKMAAGGIYDHLGGGFSRYSVDQAWLIPHFEKMLYDNGPLLSLYSQAWQITRFPLFADIAKHTADWVIREMQSDEGGYYSSLDADSEGEEGKFYVWDKTEIAELLGSDDYKIFAYQYGLDQNANFEGRWHLHLSHTIDQTAEQFGISSEQCKTKLTNAKTTLFNYREQRVRPGLDDKILGSWNGLMIKGMADAARIFQEPRYFESANNALEFCIDTLWQNNRLYVSYKDGRAHLNAYLDDYAFLLHASLSLLQTQWNTTHLKFALDLANCLLEHFYDGEMGGFFFTSHEHEKLIQRSKPLMDNATPSGNGIACLGLLQLGHLTGDMRYIEAAEKTLRLAWPLIQRAPYACISLLHALSDYLEPSSNLIIRGENDTIKQWQTSIIDHGYMGLSQVFAIPGEINDLPGLLNARMAKASTTAYLCSGTHCQDPEYSLEKLVSRLKRLDFE